MHRSPEPPPRGGSRSFDKSAWRPTERTYLVFARQAQGACAGRKAGPTALLGAPSWRGRGGVASTRLGAKRPSAASRRDPSLHAW